MSSIYEWVWNPSRKTSWGIYRKMRDTCRVCVRWGTRTRVEIISEAPPKLECDFVTAYVFGLGMCYYFINFRLWSWHVDGLRFLTWTWCLDLDYTHQAAFPPSTSYFSFYLRGNCFFLSAIHICFFLICTIKFKVKYEIIYITILPCYPPNNRLIFY